MDNTIWMDRELSAIHLNDARLDKRLIKVGSKLANNPGESIQTAVGLWADTKAAYRLFDNTKLCEHAMLKVHQDKTVERLSNTNYKK